MSHVRPRQRTSGKTKAAREAYHRRWAEAYIACGENRTQATLKCKPHLTTGSAGVEGARMLQKPSVQTLIEKRREELRQKYALTTERLALEQARLVLFNPKNLIDHEGQPKALHQIDDDTAAALSSIELTAGKAGVMLHKVKPFNKNQAINMANKMLRIYDKPPPPPPPPPGQTVDPLQVSRRLAFVLAMGAKAASKVASKPEVPVKPRKLMPVKS